MFFPRLAACFALLAVSTLPAAAQPPSVSSEKTSVSLKAEAVIANTSDVDAVGINFDLVPLAVPPHPNGEVPQRPVFLEYATGTPAVQMYQLLTRVSPNVTKITLSLTSTVSPSNQATVTVDQSVPNVFQPSVAVPSNSLLQITPLLHIEGSLTLTLRINADQSITLGFGVPPVLLRAIASSDTIVLGDTRRWLGKAAFETA